MAEDPRVRRPRLPRRRRLHGSRQLGDRPRRRIALRLHAAQRHPDLEPHGGPAPGARLQARHRHRARPRAGLPRPLQHAGRLGALGPLRDRDRRLRPRRGDRVGDRAQPAVRHPASGRASAITALDVLLVLYLQNKGFRLLEALVITLVATVGVCFLFELLLARPDIGGVMRGFIPTTDIISEPREALHRDRHPRRDGDAAQPLSALVHRADAQVRRGRRRESARRCASPSSTRRSRSRSRSSSTPRSSSSRPRRFHTSGNTEVAEIQDAYKLLTPLLGAGASTVFALALLASGQNSTLTGTLAGQIVMEGFLNIRIRPWLRRLITRAHRHRAGRDRGHHCTASRERPSCSSSARSS